MRDLDILLGSCRLMPPRYCPLPPYAVPRLRVSLLALSNVRYLDPVYWYMVLCVVRYCCRLCCYGGVWYGVGVWCYAMCGTELAYVAT
eukprot:3941938-Rhodomonas_salina.2